MTIFTIPRRPGYGGKLEIEIDCAEDASLAVKLSTAARACPNLSGTDISGFSSANLYGPNLSGTDISGANFSSATLYGATLSSATLYGANFSGANLTGANLSDANLSGANFSRANLSRVRLCGADLSGANLSGAVICGDTITRLISRVIRKSDGYEFFAFGIASGGYKILAGCRWFTDSEYRRHIADKYPDMFKAVETLHILDGFADL